METIGGQHLIRRVAASNSSIERCTTNSQAAIPGVCGSGVVAANRGMRVPVAWEPYIDVPVKGEEAVIAALEERVGVELPQPVRRVILEHAGDTPEPSGIRVGERSVTSFGPILYAGGEKDHPRYTYSIDAGWKSWRTGPTKLTWPSSSCSPSRPIRRPAISASITGRTRVGRRSCSSISTTISTSPRRSCRLRPI